MITEQARAADRLLKAALEAEAWLGANCGDTADWPSRGVHVDNTIAAGDVTWGECGRRFRPEQRGESMQTYIGTKMIRAKEMTRGDYNSLRGWPCQPDENPKDAGFLVEYLDGGKSNHPGYKGYISWSPKDVFERAYRSADGLTFGLALEALKAGLKVARRGWNGKGMYLWLLPAATVKAEWCREPHLKAVAEANGGEIECLGSIRMYTHDASGRKAVLTGWLASQSDMLCEDWEIVGMGQG